MTLKSRFSLIAAGIILFIIIAPALVLYARGFKIDFENWRFVKTGALVIKTDPAKAKIYLDDILQKSQAPTTLRFLLPQDYELRIEKDGYQSWNKRLTVKSQLVTWANLDREFLTLFRSQPQLDETVIADKISVSSNDEEIGFSQNNEYSVLSVNSEKTKKLGPVSAGLFDLAFGTNVVWQNGDQIYANFLSNQTIESNLSHATSIKRTETNGRNYLVQIENDLYSYESSQGLRLKIKNVSAWALDGQNVWYLSDSALLRTDLSTSVTDTIKLGIPQFTEGKIIRSDNGVFLLLDKTLYTINDNVEKISENVDEAEWYGSYHQLLFANSNEINAYDPATKKQELILRSLEKISNPILNQQTGYVFYKTEKAVKAVELDDRDHRNTYTIAAIDPAIPTIFTVSDNGELLYVITTQEINVYKIR
jgi:hypothetical protein